MESRKITDNITLCDHRDTMPDFEDGSRCYIVGHHEISQDILDRDTDMMAAGGAVYYSIFGEKCDVWESELRRKIPETRSVTIRKSAVDLTGMRNELIECCIDDSYKPKCYLISDDSGFIEAIEGGIINALTHCEQKIRAKMSEDKVIEFVYNGRDCVLSEYQGMYLIGYLGEEDDCFPIEFALRAQVFDGLSIRQIWNDVADQFEPAEPGKHDKRI